MSLEYDCKEILKEAGLSRARANRHAKAVALELRKRNLIKEENEEVMEMKDITEPFDNRTVKDKKRSK